MGRVQATGTGDRVDPDSSTQPHTVHTAQNLCLASERIFLLPLNGPGYHSFSFIFNF